MSLLLLQPQLLLIFFQKITLFVASVAAVVVDTIIPAYRTSWATEHPDTDINNENSSWPHLTPDLGWKKSVRIGQHIRMVQKLMECITYTPRKTFKSGFKSSRVRRGVMFSVRSI